MPEEVSQNRDGSEESDFFGGFDFIFFEQTAQHGCLAVFDSHQGRDGAFGGNRLLIFHRAGVADDLGNDRVDVEQDVSIFGDMRDDFQSNADLFVLKGYDILRGAGFAEAVDGLDGDNSGHFYFGLMII